MSISLSPALVYVALQLPQRPTHDDRLYDGSPYYDLSSFEVSTVIGCSGTASGIPHTFVDLVDYEIQASVLQFIPGGTAPDYGTIFGVDYLYARAASSTVALAVSNAIMMVSQDLGSSFPYGGSTTSGVPFNNLAGMGALFVACREVCDSLASSEIELAQKYRRGSILIDDTKKTDDWSARSKEWDAKYKRYLTMIRPKGNPSAFRKISNESVRVMFGSQVANLVYAPGESYYGLLADSRY